MTTTITLNRRRFAGTACARPGALAVASPTLLRDLQTQEAWRKRGAMFPENVKPAEYRQEIQQRILFYRNVVKTHNVILES